MRTGVVTIGLFAAGGGGARRRRRLTAEDESAGVVVTFTVPNRDGTGLVAVGPTAARQREHRLFRGLRRHRNGRVRRAQQLDVAAARLGIARADANVVLYRCSGAALATTVPCYVNASAGCARWDGGAWTTDSRCVAVASAAGAATCECHESGRAARARRRRRRRRGLRARRLWRDEIARVALANTAATFSAAATCFGSGAAAAACLDAARDVLALAAIYGLFALALVHGESARRGSTARARCVARESRYPPPLPSASLSSSLPAHRDRRDERARVARLLASPTLARSLAFVVRPVARECVKAVLAGHDAAAAAERLEFGAAGARARRRRRRGPARGRRGRPPRATARGLRRGGRR